MVWFLLVILLIVVIILASKSSKKTKLEIEELRSKKEEREVSLSDPKKPLSTADELVKLKAMIRNGDITQDEFDKLKAKLLE
jgi:septation ring formation regulator EzrA